jgi:hypothetical protein
MPVSRAKNIERPEECMNTQKHTLTISVASVFLVALVIGFVWIFASNLNKS